MATGADVPPELFRRILSDVCEDADELLNLEFYGLQDVPNRHEAIKTITACSLTCVYWARICRAELFKSIYIKNYEDILVFSTLVSSTPKTFTPISKYVSGATLVQRVGERSWVHRLWLQPSLFPFKHNANIAFYIEDSTNDSTSITPRRSISQRLFADLPRTLPSSCLQCETLIINKPRFFAPRNLTSLVGQFIGSKELILSHVTWDTEARLESDMLTRDPLRILSSYLEVAVLSSSSLYTAETAWLAFVTAQRCWLQRPVEIEVPISPAELRRTPEVLPSAQRQILDICKFFVQRHGHQTPCLVLECDDHHSRFIFHNDIYLFKVCTMMVGDHEPDRPLSDATLLSTTLTFYALFGEPKPVHWRGRDLITVDHIYALSVSLDFGLDKASNGMQYLMDCPWDKISGMCAEQEIRLELEFQTRDHITKFMDAHRAVLAKLDGRICVGYETEEHKLLQVHPETLVDLGDADEHDYIHEVPYTRRRTIR